MTLLDNNVQKQSRLTALSNYFNLTLENYNTISAGYAASFYAVWGKRLFDIAVAMLLFLLFLPLMLALLAVVAMDGGKPIFSHRRVGRNGRIFGCLKIRTMVLNSDARLIEVLRDSPVAAAEWARDRKLKKDPRVTLLGRVLRKTSLDELPQIWNVLTGDMSLVGPRPVTQDELALYGRSADAYRNIRPGITGLWQVSGRNEISYSERIRLDVHYASHYSFAQDISILARTVPAVLQTSGV